MARNFNFNTVKKYLDNKSGDSEIINAFSTIADMAVIFTPIIMGPQFFPLLEILDAKDRLVDAGNKLIGFIKKQTAPNYKERMQQIDSAYVLLCISAYFEALQEELPSSELKVVLKYFKDDNFFEISSEKAKNEITEANKSISIMFPNEVESLDDVQNSLRDFYKKTSNGLMKNIDKIILSLNNEKKNQKSPHKVNGKLKNVRDILDRLPETALNHYIAQLIDLMSSFPDFAAYIQLREFASLKTEIKKAKEEILSYDIGLNNLSSLIKSITCIQRAEEAEEICTELKAYYEREINKPIIKVNDDENELAAGVATDNEHDILTFPSIVNAYISQAYKCLRYTGSPDIKSLESKYAWENLPIRENIGDFFVKYLSLPSSVEYPLIVLGLPGSGKSILTKILSAQLMSSSYTVVRIPLRDIDANNDIDVVISDQIEKNSQFHLNHGYGGFAKHFENNPLFVIFDGYDELLQVKGDIFNGYITKIHAFQEDQNLRGRPVRVMVTSRSTLIDKVKIPKNSVIVSLEKFDQPRRNAWIEIWNNTNSEYFSHNKIKPFYLKPENKLEDNVKELAEQPLLLLMLALFDSYNNALENIGDNMSRTHLYDELIRRFCRREVHKQGTTSEKVLDNIYIQNEMTRLGIVAIGMFNRKKLHIHTKDLLSDLLTFKVKNEKGESPREADKLIRSFFFVHKSEASNDNEFDKDYAYEFLHNTFGEFLTADFILNYLVRETLELTLAHKNRHQENIVQTKLYTPNGLRYEWFLNLMFSPLYSRPLVLEMIREHLPCILNRFEYDINDFRKSLGEIIETQLKMFLEEKDLPSIIYQVEGFKEVKLPLIGHISTYTLNITVIASLLSEGGFIFDESNYASENSQDSETRPWDKLTNLWKTWFSSDNLTGLARIVKSARNGSVVTVKCRDQFDGESKMNKIETQLSVANALSDEMTIALCGIQTSKFSEITKMSLTEILRFLQSVNKDLYVNYILKMIKNEIAHPVKRVDFSNVNGLLENLFEINLIEELSSEVIIDVFATIEISLVRHMVYLRNQRRILDILSKTNRQGILGKSKSIHHIASLLSRNLDDVFDDENMYRLRKEYPRYITEYREYHERSIPLRESDLFFRNNNFPHRETEDENSFETINDDSIVEYMKSDPEMVSRFILSISNQRRMSRKIVNNYFRIINSYFHKYTEDYYPSHNNDVFSHKYQPTMNIRILLYSIQIAKNINEVEYINYAQRMLVDFTHRMHPEYMANLFFSCPHLLNIAIEFVPELLHPQFFDFLSRDIDHFDERNIRHQRSIFLALDYISLLIKFDNYDSDITLKTKHYINKFILDTLDFVTENFRIKDILSVNEYDILRWYVHNNKMAYESDATRRFMHE